LPTSQQCWPGAVWPPLGVVRPGLASTMKNHHSEEKKTHPSSKKPSRKPRQDKQMDPKLRSAKSRICYTCRKKGHLGNDCPNGNTPQSNLVHYEFHKLRNDKIDTCSKWLISSPQVSTRAIWILKNLMTNLVGHNKCWVPKSACWACRLIELNWSHGDEERIGYLILFMRRTRKWTSHNQCNLDD
jgi:hypothetical protein